MTRSSAKLAFAFGLLAAAAPPVSAQPAGSHADALAGGSAASLTDVPERGSLTVRGAFYVPAYARLSLAKGGYPIDLAVTLYVHNASDAKPLVVERITYRDTAGALVQEYLSGPVAVRPFGTIEVFVPASDVRGGTGASFVVGWAAAGPIAEPVMETLILGSSGSQGYSFVGQGRPIRTVGEQR
jgi:uncharacterized protein DUF3124